MTAQIVAESAIRKTLQANPEKSTRSIAMALGTSRARVARIREALKVPAFTRAGATRFASMDDALDTNLRRTDCGHAEWIGPITGPSKTPTVNHGQVTMPAARAQFIRYNGREPEGNVRVVCGRLHCMEATHLADAAMRAAKTRKV